MDIKIPDVSIHYTCKCNVSITLDYNGWIYDRPKEDELVLARMSHIKNTVRIILRHVPLFTICYHLLLVLSNVGVFEGYNRVLFMNPTVVLSLIANSMLCLFNLTLH